MAENIEAHNGQTSAVLDTQTGALAVSIPVSGFKFEKALMQEHFNENYMETGKYPKAIFRGQIEDFSNMDFSEPTPVKISGEITIHGVTKAIQLEGTLGKQHENMVGNAAFELNVADFDIKIPKVVINNIAETVQVMIDLEFKAQAN
ncbi:MAG: YceI family protein [Cyclobacteriaceae bacterium]|nr:YceI family protein [Cyclobacteriaceae bacterium]